MSVLVRASNQMLLDETERLAIAQHCKPLERYCAWRKFCTLDLLQCSVAELQTQVSMHWSAAGLSTAGSNLQAVS